MNPIIAPFTFKTRLKNFHLITHRVRSERVRVYIPKQLELDTVYENGVEYAFVSVGAFHNSHFHWGLSPIPYINFDQITYRTYVRYQGRRSVFFFGTLLGTLSSYFIQGTVIRGASLGDIKIKTQTQPDGRRFHSCHAAAGRGWITAFEVEALSDEPDDVEFKRFFTDRFHGLAYARGGFVFDQMVSHPPMNPARTRLVSARFDLWERLGILDRDEMENAYISLEQPEVDFVFFPPVPISLLSHGAAIFAPHHLRRSIK